LTKSFRFAQRRLLHDFIPSRVCRAPEETFEFLGYALGRCYSTRTGRAYIGTRPSKKRVRRLCEEISLLTRRATVGQEAGELVGAINARLRGWANYFSLGSVSKAYRAVVAIRGIGSVDGCAISIRSKGREANRFPLSISMSGLGSCDWKL
jgi:RNA-directed DNA polymerase